MVDPQSAQARSIYHLGITSSVIFAVIFAVVATMIFFALMRYRWREGESHQNRWRETGWSNSSGPVI